MNPKRVFIDDFFFEKCNLPNGRPVAPGLNSVIRVLSISSPPSYRGICFSCSAQFIVEKKIKIKCYFISYFNDWISHVLEQFPRARQEPINSSWSLITWRPQLFSYLFFKIYFGALAAVFIIDHIKP